MSDQGQNRRAVTLLGVGMESTTGTMVMVLRETSETGRALPIQIGPHEAHAIGLARDGDATPRPLTHQLLLDVIVALGRSLREVTVTELRDGVFLAELVLDDDTRINARPSDAVPAALTAGAPLSVATDVLEQAAGPLQHLTDGAFTDPTHRDRSDDTRSRAAETAPDEIDHQTQQLRAWLASATADDFAPDPDDPDGPHS